MSEYIESYYADKHTRDNLITETDKLIKEVQNNKSAKSDIDDINRQIDDANSKIEDANSLAQEAESAIDLAKDNGIDISTSTSFYHIDKISNVDTSIADIDLRDIDNNFASITNFNSLTATLSFVEDLWNNIISTQTVAYKERIENAKSISQKYNIDEAQLIEEQRQSFFEFLRENDIGLDFTAYAPENLVLNIQRFLNDKDVPIEMKEIIFVDHVFHNLISYGLKSPVTFSDCVYRFNTFLNIVTSCEESVSNHIQQKIIEKFEDNLDLQSFYITKHTSNFNFKKLKEAVEERILKDTQEDVVKANSLFKSCLSNYHTFPCVYGSDSNVLSQYHSTGVENTFKYFTDNKIAVDLEDESVIKVLNGLEHKRKYSNPKTYDNPEKNAQFLLNVEDTFRTFQNKMFLDKVMEKSSSKNNNFVDETPSTSPFMKL